MHPRTILPALFLAASGCATAGPVQAPSILPLRSLRLYEAGVGYFERAGTVGASAITTLPVPSGHLDDALNSLVILNGGAGGMVSGLSYSSSVSQGVARARAGLPVDVDHTITYRDLLLSLKGERVRISTGSATLVGRLIEVLEDIEATPGDSPKPDAKAPGEGARALPQKVLVLLVLTDAGELIRQKGVDLQAVRPLDPAASARLDRALDALSPRSAQVNRPLSLLGDARGAITFGYIAESPIWRTTYRLIIPAEGKGGTLQGWALVHNDTDETWKGISLSLVNGQPDSFLYPFAAPRYQRRSLVHPEEGLSTIPQLQDQTADMLWGDSPEGEIGHGSGTGGGMGFGSGHGRLGWESPCVGPDATHGCDVGGRHNHAAKLAPGGGEPGCRGGGFGGRERRTLYVYGGEALLPGGPQLGAWFPSFRRVWTWRPWHGLMMPIPPHATRCASSTPQDRPSPRAPWRCSRRGDSLGRRGSNDLSPESIASSSLATSWMGR